MANIKEALEILYTLEFNDPKNALHKNKGENGLTFMGVYQTANPNWIGWDIVNEVIVNTSSMEEASVKLFRDTKMLSLVEDIYKIRYWDRAKLDDVRSQKIANEIFIFGVNVGMKQAIRRTQKFIGVVADGIVGSQTINALNNFNEKEFDIGFDDVEIAYYDNLIERRPSLRIFKRGWHNRAIAV